MTSRINELEKGWKIFFVNKLFDPKVLYFHHEQNLSATYE